jgi:DNA-binding Xre family transcriptional regulator
LPLLLVALCRNGLLYDYHDSKKLYCQYNFRKMIYVKLREAMEAYRARTGVRLTYETISEHTKISIATLQSLATRPDYNTRLSTIEKLCREFECSPGDLLELGESTEGLADED